MAHRLRRNREAPILLRPDRGRFALRVSGRARMSAPPATRIETSDLAPFSAPYAAADEDLAKRFLADAAHDPAAEARIDPRAAALIEAIRARARGVGGFEDFLYDHSLSTNDGLSLLR